MCTTRLITDAPLRESGMMAIEEPRLQVVKEQRPEGGGRYIRNRGKPAYDANSQQLEKECWEDNFYVPADICAFGCHFDGFNESGFVNKGEE